MLLNRPRYGFKGIYAGSFHIVIPYSQPFKSYLLAFADSEYITQPDSQFIGFEQFRIPGEKQVRSFLLRAGPFGLMLSCGRAVALKYPITEYLGQIGLFILPGFFDKPVFLVQCFPAIFYPCVLYSAIS